MDAFTQVVVIASQKGGSGKTTLSGHLAVEAERSGAGPVALIDTDPQGSLAKWWNARESETPAFAEVSIPNLRDDLERLRRAGFRLIVVDTPPALTSSIAEVVGHADLVVIPSRPSPHDLRAMGPTVDIVEHERKPLVFVVNAATARARITGETAVALSQHGTVAPVTVHQRVDFAASMIDGRTVGEANPDSRSAAEITNLWAYLADRLLRIRSESEALVARTRPTFVEDVLTPARREAVAEAQNPPVIRADGPVGDDLPDISGIDTARSPSIKEPEPEPSRPAVAGAGGWDGIDRRKVDRGPPPGMPERRAFGLRRVPVTEHPVRHSEMKQ